MKRFVVPFLVLVCSFAWAAETSERVRYHRDRSTPQFIFKPDYQSGPGFKQEQLAQRYLTENWKRFGLQAEAENLVLYRVAESLLGKHYHYQQMLAGIPVEQAEIIVSVNKDGSAVTRVFNNTYPVKPGAQKQAVFQLTKDDALHVSWHHLKVHGRLNALPQAEAVYVPEQGTFKLAYRVHINTDMPFGSWSLLVDGIDGTVISAEDIMISRVRRETVDFRSYEGPLSDRAFETARIQQEEADRATRRAKQVRRVDGTATVFDPDPRTTLNNVALEDNSPAASFNAAYFTRNLLDITQSGSDFVLEGPWVEILEFSPPASPPAPDADGFWDYRRGEQSFNDAMTYFHLDQNQRYIQSLGFTGAMGIQEGPIGADANGFNGFDNSAYDPNSNRLEFGLGCVDDNEDADVILHEYGHAINFAINPNFNGGDLGAIGEGFGDYWGGVYSLTTLNGTVFNPHWIYSWDGHGLTNSCWQGRVMNNTDAQYDPDETYSAHESFFNFSADELWSTPIFQAARALSGQGISLDEPNRIQLESQFGLGAGVRMPEFAQAIVDTAQALYPGGPHAQVYVDAFAVHNIMTQITVTTATDLIFPWVTNQPQFRAQIFVNNLNDQAVDVAMTATRADGTSETIDQNIGGLEQLVMNAGDLFPGLGEGSGYTVRLTSASADIRGGYVVTGTQSASGSSPAQANVFDAGDATNIILYNAFTISDDGFSAPVVVNMGDSDADVTFRAYQGGQEVGSATRNVPAGRPMADVLSNLFPAINGNLFLVAQSSQPLLGVAFIFNDLLEPSMANSEAISSVP